MPSVREQRALAVEAQVRVQLLQVVVGRQHAAQAAEHQPVQGRHACGLRGVAHAALHRRERQWRLEPVAQHPEQRVGLSVSLT